MSNPPSDFSQSTYGGDDENPMWPLLPAHLQSILFLLQECLTQARQMIDGSSMSDIHHAWENFECLFLEFI